MTRRSRSGGRLPRGPILTYYAYVATTYASFVAAVWILFVLAQGHSYAAVGALNAVWWTCLVCSEIPTGYVGDRIGRRNAMVVGTAVVAVATAAMGRSESFWEFAVVYGAWAVGQTFRTGNEEAWLYDTLAAEGREAQFSRVRGRAAGVGLAFGAVTAPLGGALADVSFQLPFYASALATAMGVPILLTVPRGDGSTDGRFTVAAALRVVRGRMARPPLRAFVVYFALLFGVVQMTYIFDQPVIEAQARALGVPESASRTAVGVAYAGFTLVGAAVSYHTGTIRERVGTRRWFTYVPPLVGLLFAALWVAPWLALPVFFLARAVNTASRTLANHYINERVDSFGRATTLSAASMVFSLGVVPFELSGGYVADLVGPTGALATFGVALLVGGAAVWLWERPVEFEREAGASKT